MIQSTFESSSTMNTPGPRKKRPPEWLLYTGFAVLFLLFAFGGPFEHLFLGWIYFPLRVVPRMSVDWPSVVLGIVAIVAFVAALHPMLRWFVQQTPSVDPARTWSFRSTVVVALALVAMFAAGTAMVGAAHQIIWIVSSREGHPGDEEASQQRRLGSLMDAALSAREQARRTQTRNNLKMLGLAFHNVMDVNRGSLPAGGVMLSDGTAMHGWVIELNGYSTFYSSEVDLSIPWNKPPNDRLYQCGLPDVINNCQPGPYFDDDGYGLSHYAGNVHVLPVLTVDAKEIAERNWMDGVRKRTLKLEEITDGTTTTILVGTVRDRFKPWGHPANVRDPALGINQSPDGFGGPAHWKGGMFLMCDGSVKFLNESMDLNLMKALGTPAGGESIPDDFDRMAK